MEQNRNNFFTGDNFDIPADFDPRSHIIVIDGPDANVWLEEKRMPGTTEDATEQLSIQPDQEAPEERTLTRRDALKFLGGSAAIGLTAAFITPGDSEQNFEAPLPKIHTVTGAEAELDGIDGLISIFKTVYSENFFTTEKDIVDYIKNGGIVNETALIEGRGRKAEDIEAGDILILPFPYNFKG